MARVTPYAYRGASTPIHRMNAGWKLLALLAVSLASFSLGKAGLLAALSTVAIAAAVARIGPRRLFAGSLPLMVTTLFVLGLRSFALSRSSGGGMAMTLDLRGLEEGSVFALGVLVAFAGGAVLFGTTTSAQLREAVGRAEEAVTAPLARLLMRLPWSPCRRAARGLERTTLSLVFSLTLGFLPRVFEVWEAATEARAARCGKRGPLGVAAVVPLVIERLMEVAAETARAMEARGAML